ncbi:MAG: efflux RND transporter permease subunit [Gimesia chilikensis]|uniref:efflux RND transporter permease subunit n=1 Tax=Gimesia chilikensis TaxID=2605989 RepID=UPI0037A699A6
MNLLDRFIERPVLATVTGLVILLLGVQAMTALTVREYPETTSSTIRIVTPYIGANAELVQGFITTPLEQTISTAEGIDYLESSSSLGISTITARLELGYDPNAAVAEILTKIQQVRNRLPQGSENSIVTISRGNNQAAMYLAFYSDVLKSSEITDYLNRAVRPRLETVSGVQQANVIGAQNIAMRLWLNPDRMAALKVTPIEVYQAIADSNFLSAVGETKGTITSIPLKADTNLQTVESFENLVIREQGDTIIRLRDVAQVELGAESYDSSIIFEGQNVAFIGVQVAPEANLLDTIAGVRKLIPEVRAQLPAGLEGIVVYDSTEAVQDSIDEVISSLVEALLIVTVVIYLFLGSFRSALVPGVAMPLAIVGAFFLMQMLGYSINLLTLLALILAIGTVVDDGIVMVENASRHLENGATPEEAARRTIRELAGSIVAMNIVVVAVFAPVGLMGGLTGSLFTEFAYTIAGATLISGILALSVSPMMCATLLKADMQKRWLADKVDRGFHLLSKGYASALRTALGLRWSVLTVGVLILGSLYFLYSAAAKELSPPEDEGFLIVSAQADPNTSLDHLERWTGVLADQVRPVEGVQYFFSLNGGRSDSGGSSSSAFGGVILKDWEKRQSTQMQLQRQLQGVASEVAGLESVVIAPPTLPGAGEGAPVQFVISSLEDPRVIHEVSQDILQKARESGLFTYIQSDLKYDKLEQRISVDRDKAAALGVNIGDLGGDLSTMLSAGYVNYFSYDGRSYRVIPQVGREHRLQAEQLLDYRVATRDGELVPLSLFVSLEDDIQPRQLKRFNQLNAATLSGVPAPGVSFDRVIAFLRKTVADSVDRNVVTDWKGQSRQYVTENTALMVAFALAVLLMYLTLSAQYESFRDPAIMFVSIPMSLAGAMLFLALGVTSVNIYTQVGLLALIGSIIRHGILLVEFANEIQKEDGLDRHDAILKAAALRFRSILMTTICTLVGLIPLLIASGGPGAASRFAISFTLGVGMAIGTFFTLFMVPALYTLLATRHS